MTQEHPITLPSEGLVLQWSDEWYKAKVKHMTRENYMCMQAALWGADQELEACCESEATVYSTDCADGLRRRRRPKSPSLKEQALALLDDASDRLDAVHENTIRRALESLPDQHD
jgi:hypothetical protein